MAIEYRLNGVQLTESNGGMPSKHHIEYTAFNQHDTLGGTVLTEPTGGRRRIITWEYDLRKSVDLTTLFAALDFDNSPVSLISCPDIIANSSTGEPYMITNLVVVCAQKPSVATPGHRDRVDSFSLVFVEQYPQ